MCVILPIIGAAIYYEYIASDQYVAEFRFVVTDIDTTPVVSTATSAISSIIGAPSTPNMAKNYMVTDYLTSQQAIQDLMNKVDVKAMYSQPGIDWWARFDGAEPMEQFAKYWQRMITASYDQITGLAICQVRAFTAEDAYQIAANLVQQAEALTNKIGMRAQREAVRNAEIEMERAELRLKAVRAKMTEFRNTEGVIDPNTSVVTNNVALAQTLRLSLTGYQTELLTMKKHNLSASASTVKSLESKIQATNEQLAAIEAQIASARTGNNPISEIVGRYEQLDMERQFAQNMVLSTMQSLEQVRASSLTQHIFVTPYVMPILPASSTYPNRIQSILTVAGGAFLLWTMGLLVMRSIREHLA